MAALAFPTAVLGACVGSFLNVVAWRLPRGESLLHPGSHCPRCGAGLTWIENLPVLGWLRLRGRCAHCSAPIAARYPAVEVLTAGLWVSVLAAGPGSWSELLAGWLLLSWLLAMALIDLDHLWLPEPLCRWGTIAGIVATLLLAPAGSLRPLLLAHLLAAALALLALESLSALAERVLGQPALGLGDAKLAAMLGAWLGPLGVAIALALAVFSGAVYGLTGRLSGLLAPRQAFPFGPFLALGGWLVWVLGPQWWLRLWLEWPLLIQG
ncbi:prepilin peptidase [Synechococcus sp. RSCCF101]|uniref:prepilin peptidase n=1 Tax=Synechococcus sp. RSCCF101 TaxID=2511069 RepID=UPI001244BD20|nr:A24 family peptidase [Synechococcus sp. RSCCF101]QEY33367.1 prepilin peptidase [Synechococcus sp. RSCCF101]